MTKTVWKKQLKLSDLQDVAAPRGAKLLAFRNQNEEPCIWFLCDPEAPNMIIGKLRIMGTGHMTDMLDEPGWNFVGTDLFHRGVLVLHAFFQSE